MDQGLELDAGLRYVKWRGPKGGGANLGSLGEYQGIVGSLKLLPIANSGSLRRYTKVYMGGCQNYGPFLGP